MHSVLELGFTSNKPTHYLLDYGDFLSKVMLQSLDEHGNAM